MKKFKNLLIAAALLILSASPLAGTARITFLHSDATGSPVAATNEAGAVIWRKTYAPYGKASNKDGDNRIGYTGHVEDQNGLVYAGARYYDPALGRFLSDDPSRFSEANPMSFNRYLYANNNPYRFTDPNGKSPEEILNTIADASLFIPEVGPAISGEMRVLAAAVKEGSATARIGSEAGAAARVVGAAESDVPVLAEQAGVIVGGGAIIENIAASDVARIQKAANRIGSEISVVGSRASGTAKATSDWDYVVNANAKTRNNLSKSLPGAGDIKEGIRANLDIFKGAVDDGKPFISFKPE